MDSKGPDIFKYFKQVQLHHFFSIEIYENPTADNLTTLGAKSPPAYPNHPTQVGLKIDMHPIDEIC
jgi:hypothetical protein